MDAAQVRRFALGLPGAEEYEHGGLPAFRVRGRRFASMLAEDGINLMPGEDAIREAVAEWPQACHEQRFGQRLAAVRVEFADLDPAVVRELITDAWRSKAPARLAAMLP
jgi:hypothetical protein